MSFQADWGPAMSWSPDGRELAYVAATPVGDRVLVESAEGTDGRRIAHLSSGGPLPYSAIAWSPDGRRIAFTDFQSSGPNHELRAQLWVINADGSDPRVVLEAPSLGSPAWSPDSSRLAISRSDGTVGSLLLVDPDGGGVTPLDTALWSEPAWDPTGTALAGFLGHELVLVPVDGSPAQIVAKALHRPLHDTLAWKPAAP